MQPIDPANGRLGEPVGPAEFGGYAHLALGPGGRLAALAGGTFGQGHVRLIDLASGRVVRRLEGHPGLVSCAAFSPDGRTLASCGADGSVRLWRLADGECLLTLPGVEPTVRAVAFTPDGSRLLAAGSEGVLRVFDLRPGPERSCHRQRFLATALARTPEAVAAGLIDGRVLMIDPATGRPTGDRPTGTNAVAAACYLPGPGRLVVGSLDRKIVILPRGPGGEPAVIDGRKVLLNGVAADPARDEFAAVCDDSVTRVFDADGKPLRECRGKRQAGGGCRYVGRLLAVGGNDRDRFVRLYDPATGGEAAALPQPAGVVCLAAQGTSLAVATSNGRLAVWDVESRKILLTLCDGGPPLTAVALAGGVAVGGRADGKLDIWDARSGKHLATYAGHTAKVSAAELLPDGRSLVTAAWDGSVRVWNLPPR